MRNVLKISILLNIIFLPLFASAQIIITEIMYAPATGEAEWIEIHNSSDAEISLLNWRFFNSKDTSAPLRIQNGSEVVGPGAYAIITTLANSSYFSGIVFSSSQFTLPDDSSKSNTYKAISDSDKNIIDFVEYNTSIGAEKNSGKSLQRIGNSWVASVPTPGLPNIESTIDSFGAGESFSASQSFSSNSQNTSVITTSNSVLDITFGGDRMVTVGTPVNFQATIKKNTVQNNSLDLSWSFGDGYVGVGKNVTHTYKYPGDYALVLRATAGDFVSIAKAVVRVIEPKINIIEERDSIILHNTSNQEINLFNWKIVSQNKGYIFQADTIILPNSKIIIEKDMLKMKGERSDSTKLFDSKGIEVGNYSRILGKAELKEINRNIESAWIEVGQIVDSAIALNLVKEKMDNYYNAEKGEDSNTIKDVEPEVLGETNSIEEEQIPDIIYEAPKKKSFTSNIFVFFADLFR